MDRRERLKGLNARGLLRQALGDTSPPDTSSEETFPTFAGFQTRSVLGRGATGVVYEGWQESLQRPVAIKVLSRQHMVDELLRERLMREARQMASLHHPHIVAVHDFISTGDGGAGIVMELVSGPSLRQLLRESAKLSVHRSLDLGVQIADALATVHQAGLTHRDLKPENILIDGDVGAKVTDFGIAYSDDGAPRLTLTGMSLGTDGYMPPEQSEGRSVDERCDIYSLGVVLYEMLNGTLPRGRIDQMVSHCPGLPDGVCATLVRALQPDREKRIATMLEFREELAALRASAHAPKKAVGLLETLRQAFSAIWHRSK
jgi:serine/threonine-protein kinase